MEGVPMTLVLSPLMFNKTFMRSTQEFMCCEEMQYRIYCDAHFAFQGCQHCEFNIHATECECEN